LNGHCEGQTSKKNCFSVIFRYDDDLDEVEEEDHFEDVDDLEVKKKQNKTKKTSAILV